MISPQTTTLAVIDVQENLMPVIHNKDDIAEQIATLVQGANILDVPVVVTEQYPERLGQTISAVSSPPIWKSKWKARRAASSTSAMRNA